VSPIASLPRCRTSDADKPQPSGGSASAGSASGANASAGSASGGNASGGANQAGPGAGGASGGSGAVDCRAKGDGKSTITLINHCTGTLSFRGSSIQGGELEPGQRACLDVGTDKESAPAIRFFACSTTASFFLA